jgi:voltage-gated potassium channel
VAFLILIIVLGTLGYVVIEGWGFFDALYMAVITLTTTGYSEVHPLNTGGRIFTIIVLTSGFFATVVAVGALTHFLIEGQILELFGRRRMAKDIEGLKDHYIICGYGRIGKVIAGELSSKGIQFVIVDSSYEKTEEIIWDGYIALHGNSVDENVLVAAGIMRAKGLIACVSTPADNVYIVLTARALKPDIFVMGRANDETSEKRLVSAGADKVVSPYTIGGRRMANIITKPAVVEFIDIAVGRKDLKLAIEEVTVCSGSNLIGKSIINAEIKKKHGVIVVAVLKGDGKMIFNPEPTLVIDEGDILVALGQFEGLKALASACLAKGKKG